MALPELFHDLLFDYTLRTVALGAAILGCVSGTLGSYAVLRRQSLLGDAISHAALPGIALAFLLTGSKAPLVLVLGAAAAGWLGTLLVMGVVRTTRVKFDSALGIILSVFFGVGLVLLTFIQKRPDATQAGLDRFLFGQAATLLAHDVVTMAALGGLALLTMLLFWKELKLLSFDPEFGSTLGFPIRALDVLLTTLLVVAIVVGLQTVGVVLMSALVVAPAAAARQWTNRLGVMVALAGSFGALAGVSGAVLSSSAARLPTGPLIVLCASALVLLSLCLAPNRGIVWNALRQRRNRRRLQVDGEAIP
ncbi:MAG: iron chelate uptake ABC transporter family permease subunit [Sphaerobacter sp.]|nr:iron chelate uptake ABC transporter family permease subunit [Sphaerobacter sp.]